MFRSDLAEEIKVHEVLSNARAIQAERGHARDTLEDVDGSVCVGRALILGQDVVLGALGSRPLGRPSVAPFVEALGFENVDQMIDWNNEPERILEDVLARFDEALEVTESNPA